MKRKAIGIISGKGGVGKTSLTAALASIVRTDNEINAIILDCDVDAPNLALILPAESNSKIESLDTFTTLKATFLEDKCVQCRQCIDDHFCEFNALKWEEENSIPTIDYLACEGCGACKVLCPEHAFEINTVKSGEIISYKTNITLPLIYGKTRLGSTTSGKLVSDVKEYAKQLDEFEDCNLILIDGPPGIGCPVIATVSGLDYIITITEPTPSGLHDLVRAIEVVQQFEIPFGIVINKFDLKSPFQDDFKEYIDNTGFYILGKIPFDLSIPKAMSYAEAVVDFAPNSDASLAIKAIYNNLKNALWNSR
ncbi:MAG: (4Fe-4S)-binding protein [Promethearchaeota archaeon]|nr:MAG: (4Fe-4S)-binding protein [Candidatus Lokiarchaeota archaeon]